MWIPWLGLCVLCALLPSLAVVSARMHESERRYLQQQAREMFYHGYRNYMDHAFPWDELKPLSCEGRRWDQRERGDLDDVLGGFSLTLVDSLDMLAILGDREEFARAVKLVIDHVSFDRDVTVSVFESTIRVIGGLVSAHLMASPQFVGMLTEHEYQGELLTMAVDLAWRLMPAFNTPTGIPVHRVNLRHGVTRHAPTYTCPAAAGSLLVEMSYLSRLANVTTFEAKARRAVEALWIRRSSLDLLGSSIDVVSGEWLHSHVGIGAGLDSFYEYLLKYHLISGDEDYLQMFNMSYSAMEHHANHDDVHIEVDMHYGREYVRSRRVSALQAFWPGLQVLAGDVGKAMRTHDKLFSLWNKFGAMPELFDVGQNGGVISWARTSPLRPELIESTYHLYQATGDHKYLKIGRKLLHDIQTASKVQCGYAAIGDIHTLVVEDRMDSYFLSETVKYLYLLFSADPDVIVPRVEWNATTTLAPTGHNTSNCSADPVAPQVTHRSKGLKASEVVFSTEGHVLLVHPELFRRDSSRPVSNFTFACENGRELVRKQREEMEAALTVSRTFVPVGVSIRLDHTHVITAVAAPASFGHRITNREMLEAPLQLYSSAIGTACESASLAAQSDVNVQGKVVMVRRGACSFAAKAHVLQKAGAVGVIIVNDVPTKRQRGDRKYVISDDAVGTGRHVRIPVVMISREDAVTLHREVGAMTQSTAYTSDEEAEMTVSLSPWLL